MLPNPRQRNKFYSVHMFACVCLRMRVCVCVCVQGTANQLVCLSIIIVKLRHYATSREVTGSFPDKVIGFFS
jgi:hypothetical protein